MASSSSSSAESGPIYTLVAQDGIKVATPRKVACMSGLVSSVTEDKPEDEAQEVSLANVNGRVLQKVIEYCDHHVDHRAEEIEKPLKGKLEDVIEEWDRKYLEIDQALLIELILAANYMNIKDLLDLTCAKVASMIKGKTPEEIRQMFNIENDFTPEEEERIREENRWCEEQ